MRVDCKVEETEVRNESGRWVKGVQATCSLCGKTTESYGVGERSISRCLVLLSRVCPNEEKNFYVEKVSIRRKVF